MSNLTFDLKRKLIYGLFLFIYVNINVCSQQYDPTCNPNSTIVIDNVRFTILTDGLIRMEWSEQGEFQDKASLVFVNRNHSKPEYSKSEKNGWLTINTNIITLKYKIGSGMFTDKNLSIELHTPDMNKKWVPGTENKGNLLGTIRTLDGVDGDSSLYYKKKIQLQDGILSRDGWTFIEDSNSPIFDNSEWPWVEARDTSNHQDFYFFGYGYDYKKALADFTLIAGKIALPPRYIFGYWFSRWHPFSEMEFREMISQFETQNIPLDVLVIDMDWHATGLPEFFKDGKRTKDKNDQMYGWTGFTWNKNYFPDPAKFLNWTNEKGLKTCLNLHPASGFHPHEEAYQILAEQTGVDTATGEPVQFDIVDKKFAKLYFKYVLHPMEQNGIDFWWLDWQQWNTTSIEGVNPTFYLNYVHHSDMERRGKRPLIYHRWGGLGNHRYQIGFSGDTYISWKSLDYQPYFTATASNVGFGFWGNDIGGFYGGRSNPQTTSEELFVRWFQYGVFSPLLKTHATCYAPIKRKIWEYSPENFFHLRELIQLRRSLIPYIYHSAHQAYETGVSLCRPLYYEYPNNEKAYQYKNEYFFGDNILVHPITKPVEGDSLFVEQTTWLPEGMWTEWFTGKMVTGGREINSSFAFDEIPVYCKEGAIIPMMDSEVKAEDIPGKLIFKIIPGQKGELELYEDASSDNKFKFGEYSITSISFSNTENKISIDIGPVEGYYAGIPNKRSYEIKLFNQFYPRSVTVNGVSYAPSQMVKEGHYSFNGQLLETSIHIPKTAINKSIHLEIELIKGDIELLNQKIQKMRSMYQFSKFLAEHRNFWKQDEWNDAYYSSDVVMKAATTPLRLEQDPLNIIEILKEFDHQYDEVIWMLQQINKEHQVFEPYLELMEGINKN